MSFASTMPVFMALIISPPSSVMCLILVDLEWTSNSAGVLAEADYFGYHRIFSVDMQVSHVRTLWYLQVDTTEYSSAVRLQGARES